MFRGLNIEASVSPVLIGMVMATSAFAAGDFDPVTANVSGVAATDRAPSNDMDAFVADPQKLFSGRPVMDALISRGGGALSFRDLQ